jgi:hypothetical protein
MAFDLALDWQLKLALLVKVQQSITKVKGW